MLHKLLLLMLAGGLGTLARYGLAGLVQRLAGGAFPWGTLVVNITGCFLAGFFWTLATGRLALSGETRMVVLIGFLGAFTTFSTYIFETGGLLRDSQWLRTVGNITLQNAIGLLALFTGHALGRLP